MGGVLAARIDVAGTDKEVAFSVELPGVEEKDIEISLVVDRLTIKGEKKSEHEDQQDQNGHVVHRIERCYGSFRRTMTVPYAVDPVQVPALFKDGVLKVRLPKPANAQQQEGSRSRSGEMRDLRPMRVRAALADQWPARRIRAYISARCWR
jgi:HSP20 family molecular chaperone IbpA